MIIQNNANDFFERVNPVHSKALLTYLAHMPQPIIGKRWVAGGALRRTVTGDLHTDGDFDIFFASKEDYDDFHRQMVFEYNANVIKIVSHVSEYVINSIDMLIPPLRIQAITLGYFKSPEELIQHFDFTCCMCAYDGLNVYYDEYFLWDNSRKRIVVNKIEYPIASLRRLIKYSKQGYYACNGTLQTIAEMTRSMGAVDFQKARVTYVD